MSLPPYIFDEDNFMKMNRFCQCNFWAVFSIQKTVIKDSFFRKSTFLARVFRCLSAGGADYI